MFDEGVPAPVVVPGDLLVLVSGAFGLLGLAVGLGVVVLVDVLVFTPELFEVLVLDGKVFVPVLVLDGLEGAGLPTEVPPVVVVLEG